MELLYQNARGAQLSLTNNPYFHLLNIDGQTRANANLSSVVIGGVDGDTVNNVQAQPRQVILDLRVKSGANVEDAKRDLLGVVKLKQRGTLLWTQNNRTVQLTGVIEAIDMPRWNNAVTMQVTMHCEQPFWEDVDDVVTEISEALALHYFTDFPDDMLYFPELGIPLGEYDVTRTKTFYNSGDVAVGIEIEILAYKDVVNPILYDIDGNFFGVGYGAGAKQVTLHYGDIIRICTEKGAKSVTKGGESLLDKIKPGSTWVQLAAGENRFTISSDDGQLDNMTFTLHYKRRFI